MRGWLLIASILLASPAWADEPPSTEGFAPDVGTVPVGLRVDFRLGFNVTDGVGVIDHPGLGASVGPVFGRACPGCPPVVSPYAELTFGIAEEGRPSLRAVGGLELGISVARDIELVPSVFGGYFHAFKDDERRGGTVGASLALRVRGPDHFFFSVEPLRFVLLPPPPLGATRYTTHFALDFGVVRFGGITP